MSTDAQQLARYIDHTYLKPDATTDTILRLCEEAKAYNFYSVCVNGAWVKVCEDALKDTNVQVAAVVGFPLGAMATAAKAYEAAQAVSDGAKEIDMVLYVGALLEGRYAEVQGDIRSVVESVRGKAIVKVILETGYLNEEQIRRGCVLAEEAGAHFVKTSTGFGPGGAEEAHIQLMRASVSPAVGVKASGGIRDAETALKMVAAGANRLGTSSGVAIVTGAAGSAGTGTY